MFLTDKISLKIAAIAKIADDLPCVTMIHKISDASIIWMSNKGLKELNISLEELTNLKGQEYYERYFNKEDFVDYNPKIMGLLERNNDDECISFFQQVRINNHEKWTWHMTSVKIFMRDENNLPILCITQSMPIDTMHSMTTKASRILEENNFLREHIDLYARLTKREIQILKYWVRGNSAKECGEKFFISAQTVETHRKNIRKKLHTNSFHDLTKFGRAFDLI